MPYLRPMPLRAVIVDDIDAARDSLADDLASLCPEIILAGEAPSVERGVRLIDRLQPEVLFLDIELQDGTGFDILKHIKPYSYQVIFITGNDQYAIKAIRAGALDYIMKPVDPDELVAAVQKLSTGSSSQERVELTLRQMQQPDRLPARIALNSADRIHYVQTTDILRMEAEGNYTAFYLQKGEKILVTQTLKTFDELLSGGPFLRVHHSHLVNLKQVKEFLKNDGGSLLMQNGNTVPVAVRRKEEVLRKLEENLAG